jgi:ABC-type sugar transport system ATPase subunit
MAVATMLVVMRAGTIEQIGSPTEVYRYPATTHVARFIGNPQMNIVAPAGALRDLADTLAVQYGVDQSAVRSIGIRPEHLAVGTTADGWRASARVNSVLATGPAVIVRLSLSDGIELTALCPSDTYLETGSETQLVLNPERVHCFGLDDRRLGQHTPSRELVGAGEVPGR